MKTAFGALLFAALLLSAGETPVQVSQAPTTPTTIVAGLADVKKESAPSLRSRREETHLTATIGGPVIESGGGPEVKYTVSSNQGHVELKAGGLTDLGGTYVPTTFRSGKEVVETDGTEITYSGQHFVGFTQADQRGTCEAPVGTVLSAKVEIDKSPGTHIVDAKTLSAHPLRVQERESSRQGAAHAKVTKGAAMGEQTKYEGMYA